MKAISTIYGTLLAGALLLAGGAAPASEFDRAMEPILSDYLAIHEALASDTTEGIGGAVETITTAARRLDPAQAEGEQAQHYEHISLEIVSACERLRDADDIEAAREAFKELSKPISAWVEAARPEGASVMYCPMAKAGWVQRGAAVANPYYGAQMLGCGERAGGEHDCGEHGCREHEHGEHRSDKP
jgi:Cu(I)/Ag(I) efflux system membrane fusion protein